MTEPVAKVAVGNWPLPKDHWYIAWLPHEPWSSAPREPTEAEVREAVKAINEADTVRDLIERLAPAEPMNQDEQGGCVWCDGNPPGHLGFGYATADPADHANDCPWVAAQRWLAT